MIETYSLSAGEKNIRRIQHINAQRLEGQQAYDAYVELVGSYRGDYLAAFQAGEMARELERNDDAITWYNRALEINPNYEPAQLARAKMQ